MATIAAGRDVLTLVNVFTVKPEDQQRLAKLLIDATEQTMLPSRSPFDREDQRSTSARGDEP